MNVTSTSLKSLHMGLNMCQSLIPAAYIRHYINMVILDFSINGIINASSFLIGEKSESSDSRRKPSYIRDNDIFKERNDIFSL